MDVGNAEHWVAVPPNMDPEPVRQFGCYTAHVLALADWLQQLGIETVALQSTGVSWVRHPSSTLLAVPSSRRHDHSNCFRNSANCPFNSATSCSRLSTRA